MHATDSKAAGPRQSRRDSAELAELASLAGLCKAAGDPLRLQILGALQQDSLSVQELCTVFGIRQPAMSHHLKVMAENGLMTHRREGNSSYYRRAMPNAQNMLAGIQGTLLGTLDQVPLPAQLKARLDKVRRARERSSRVFFQQNADKFRAQQDLIASYEQYADTVVQALENAPLSRHDLALEVGPGDGAFLAELGPRFTRVIALDNAEEMLAKSRSLAASRQLDNIEFIQGDTRHPGLQDILADCIVVNMVLHHTPSPAEIFADLANCLAADGVLLVTDLCRHDQDWARESCGDLWLGFEPDDLLDWARRVGLDEVASVFLAQRNGFQVQVRLFGRNSANKD